jgi:hypothetical protein
MAQKRHTRPVMAKIILSCSTQMVLTFIDSKGVIYGYGSTDLRLDTSTKLKMENYW